jgi:predicted nucleic acid-binding protein
MSGTRIVAELHLDTNALIALADPALPLFQLAFAQIETGDLPATSAVAWHEFVRGLVSMEDVTRADLVLDGRIVPLDREASELAAKLFLETGSRRASTADCLIAATAIQAGAVLLTSNRDDFIRFKRHGLQLLTP